MNLDDDLVNLACTACVKPCAEVDVASENPAKEPKTCFVISPIGPEDSPARRRANDVFEFIIDRAVSEFGYKAVRADHIADAGIITSQVIDHTVGADLVVADLTSHNPNVMYELAVRHTVRKPVVQLIERGDERIPFDIQGMRTIHYGLGAREAAEAVDELKKAVQALEARPDSLVTPVQFAVSVESLSITNDPHALMLGQMSNVVTQLSEIVAQLNPDSKAEVLDPFLEEHLNELLKTLELGVSNLEDALPNLSPEHAGANVAAWHWLQSDIRNFARHIGKRLSSSNWSSLSTIRDLKTQHPELDSSNNE